MSVEDVPEPRITGPNDAIVKITTTNSGHARPSFLVSHELPLDQAPEGYQHFDNRDEGWTKVLLKPAA